MRGRWVGSGLKDKVLKKIGFFLDTFPQTNDQHENIEYPFFVSLVLIRAGKSKSLIHWKKQKGGKEQENGGFDCAIGLLAKK